MRYVLGIDAGGTKTVCLLADERGHVVSRARGAGANLQASGELQLEKTLHALMEEAIGGRTVTPASICLGIAGVDRDEDASIVQGLMRRIGYQARLLVVNDALVALTAGIGDAPGVVIIAGTGSIAYGRAANGKAARAGGWGHVLGDEGSGYWIGRLALRAVVREADRRSGATLLTPRVLAHFGVARPEQLIHEVYARRLQPSAIAALAVEVQAAADAGDPIAMGILDRAVEELVVSARSVTARLHLESSAFPFVLAGGIFRAVPWLGSRLERRLQEVARSARVEPLAEEPAAGAVRIAIDHLEGRFQMPVYD
jgi:N-acetylglucosamine kinase-like BadF-type ATPase